RGNRLVGVDADGIQMRIFAHYTGDEKLINALLNGKKEDGTDIHSINREGLGHVCRSRDVAKTFIYAWLLGAGSSKISEILECSFSEARGAIDSFLASYPGLRSLKKEQIPSDAARGYFQGLDGRYVAVENE